MNQRILWLALLFAGALVGTTWADDVIELKDGSIIKGEITSMKGGKLSIANASAGSGSIEVKFTDIKSIKSTEAHTVELTNGDRVTGIPALSDGNLRIATDLQGAVEVKTADVKAINPPPKKDVTHKGNVGMVGNISDGNTRRKSIGASANYVMRGKDNRLSIAADWNYAEDAGALTARNASGRMKYDYFLNERTFAYVNSFFEGDAEADLNLRTTLGGGVGHQFLDPNLDDTDVSYYEEAGISFFDEDYDGSPDDNYASARLAGKINWNITQDVEFYHFHELYIGFESEDDLYADTKTGIRMKLAGDLFANAQVSWSWDNTSAPGNNRTDTVYLWGLGYSFEF